MKTIITVTICIGLLVAGCAPYQSPLNPALQALTEQKQALDFEAERLKGSLWYNNEEQKRLTEKLQEFMASLNNEQRESFEELYLQNQRGEITEITLAQRIEKVLSTEEYAEFNELLNLHNKLVVESNELITQAQTLQNRYTDLQRRQRLVLQIYLAQEEASRRHWQQLQHLQQQQQTYRYQQQQLYELGEINRNLQDLWIQQQNQQGGIQIIPAPRPVPPY